MKLAATLYENTDEEKEDKHLEAVVCDEEFESILEQESAPILPDCEQDSTSTSSTSRYNLKSLHPVKLENPCSLPIN